MLVRYTIIKYGYIKMDLQGFFDTIITYLLNKVKINFYFYMFLE